LNIAHHIGKANAPKIQAAYWVGGYQASDTTVSITDSTKNYASGMIQLNTTTGEYVALSAPFTPVQEGALAYIPVGEMGILLYVGGEVPSIQNGINATLTPVCTQQASQQIVRNLTIASRMHGTMSKYTISPGANGITSPPRGQLLPELNFALLFNTMKALRLMKFSS
jgi:hypothetical protein